MFLQATILDIHRNTHNLSTSKGSQSKTGYSSQVKTKLQTKWNCMRAHGHCYAQLKSLPYSVTHSTDSSCLWGTEGDERDAKDWNWENVVTKRKHYNLIDRRPTAWYLQASQLAGTARLKGPEATSWLHSESLLFLALSYGLLEKEFLLPLVKWQDTVEIAQAQPWDQSPTFRWYLYDLGYIFQSS